MPEASPFISKVLSRLDKLGKDELRRCITDLMDVNAKYGRLLDRLATGVLIVSSGGDIRYANNQAELWLGFTFDQGKKTIHDPDLDEVVRDWLGWVVTDRQEERLEDLRVLNPREMVLRMKSFRLSDDTERIENCVLIDNVTAEVRREEEKYRQSKQESLLRLASGVAHEVGNPLNAIQIHLTLLKKDIESLNSEKQKQMADKVSVIQAETKRLDKIIRSFLSATRKPPLRFKHENLNVLIGAVLHVLEPEIESHKIQVEFAPDEKLPEFLMDRERIHEIFMNLVKNACEAMKEGGSLKVSVSHKDKVASVRIRDTGPGITEEDLPNIFDAYYTTKTEGSGLGLMTVYNGVMDHGGRIEVDSQLSKGTTFNVLLPVREPKKQLPDLTR